MSLPIVNRDCVVVLPTAAYLEWARSCPDGDTTLIAGDVITAFGTESSRQRMIDRLNAGADEPTACDAFNRECDQLCGF